MMEAKPLEAIPEENDAPATPDRVTSDGPKTKPTLPKHPGRVAAGKRLAEHNRKAREAKKKQAEAQKPPTTATTEANTSATNNTTEQSSNNSTNTVYLILTVGGLVVSAFGVYYQREASMTTLGRSQKTQTTAVEPNTVVEENLPPPIPKVKCGIIRMKQFQIIYIHDEHWYFDSLPWLDLFDLSVA